MRSVLFHLAEMSQDNAPPEYFGVPGKPKRWSRSMLAEYFMNIDIRTCIEVIESGLTLNLPMIHLQIMEGWHTRCLIMFNLCFVTNNSQLSGTSTNALVNPTPNPMLCCIPRNFGSTRHLKMKRNTRHGEQTRLNWANQVLQISLEECSKNTTTLQTRFGRNSS